VNAPAADAQRKAREQLGAELARLRSLAGLGQRELASQAGLTQSKTSRVENGRAVPSRSEVHAWLNAVHADARARTTIEALLESTHTQVVAWRSAIRSGSGHLQHDVARLEAEAATIHGFACALIPGILQTPAYARALFARLVPLDGHDDEVAVSARIQRQEQLYTPGKRFSFVITEHALRWTPGAAADQLAQLDRLGTLAQLPNIELAVVPAGAEPGPALHDYLMFLDRPGQEGPVVNVELTHADLTIDDPDDIALYRHEWERWHANALRDADARRHIGGVFNDLASETQT
jgi:transcriptional regulator with XRE-family HTH domain